MAQYQLLARILQLTSPAGFSLTGRRGELGLRPVTVYYLYPPGEAMGRLVAPEWGLLTVEYAGPVNDIFALDSSDLWVLPGVSERVDMLSPTRRSELRTRLDAIGSFSYDYTNQGGERITVDVLPTADISTGTMTGSEILRRLHDYLQLGKPIGIAPQQIDHNTEFSEDFTSSPLGGTMNVMSGIADNAAWVHDSGNGEIDAGNSANQGALRHTGDTGSIDMESQDTKTLRGGSNAVSSEVITRVRPSAATFYAAGMYSDGGGDVLVGNKKVAGAHHDHLEVSGTYTVPDNDWFTIRVSASGSGATVTVNIWITDHNTSTKPSNPGWIGVDASPTHTFADSTAQRILDSDARQGGVYAYNGNSANTNVCTVDWWKARAISDRGAGRYQPARRYRGVPQVERGRSVYSV